MAFLSFLKRIPGIFHKDFNFSYIYINNSFLNEIISVKKLVITRGFEWITISFHLHLCWRIFSILVKVSSELLTAAALLITRHDLHVWETEF